MDDGAVLLEDGSAVMSLLACGEWVGGVFLEGCPGGSGPASGTVFGRRAGARAGPARLLAARRAA